MNNAASFSTISDFFRVNAVKPNEARAVLSSFGLTVLTLKKSDRVENDAELFIKVTDCVIDVNHITFQYTQAGLLLYAC